MNKRKTMLLSLVVALALTLSACGGSSKEPTPTPVDPNLIAAQAIATFSMGLTQTAFANPTATFTLTPPPTNTLAPTFAPLGTNTAAVPTNPCNSAFTGYETFPDNTVVAPGQNIDKVWRLQNTGTCTWTPTFKAVFTGSGNGGPMGGVTTQIGKTVKPGETYELLIEFVAPTAPGEYTSWWKLQDDQNGFFGTAFSIVIKVVGAASTATPTETPTATP